MTLEIDGLPPVAWTHGTGDARVAPSGVVLTAGPGTDWFNDASGSAPGGEHSATSLSFDSGDTDFRLSARVRVELPRSTFDAGVVTLWADDDHWAKLCFEQSPQGQAMVVSVVTNGYSDDANGPVIESSSVWLRISRVGPAFAFHYSDDGRHWHFVRLFRLATTAPIMVGFMAQAPFGERAVAWFEDVSLDFRTLTDFRSGE